MTPFHQPHLVLKCIKIKLFRNFSCKFTTKENAESNHHSFANGRSTALILDLGHQHTTATPVYDGLALLKGTHAMNLKTWLPA